jgi:hypothetical protein
MYAPLVYSSNLRKSSYIEVVAPTVEEIHLENITKKNLGYSVTLDKVEFAERETRIYATVTNDGKSVLYFGDVIAIQGGKQYASIKNYDADYEEIPYEIATGASCSGTLIFPPMSSADFELSFNLHSGDVYENLGEYVFIIGKESSGVKEPEKPFETFTPKDLQQEKYGYSISIDKVEFYKQDTRIYLTVTNNGPANLNIATSRSVIVQNSKQYGVHRYFDTDPEKFPDKVYKGSSISGVIVFPAMGAGSIDFTIDIYSDNYDDELGEITVSISKIQSTVKTPWPTDPSAVGTYYHRGGSWESYLYIRSDGTLYEETFYDDGLYSILYGEWTQDRDVITYSVWDPGGLQYNNPFYDDVYETGIYFFSTFYVRQ